MKKYLNTQNDMINGLIQKIGESKKKKQKKELEIMKQKIQTLESKIIMSNLEKNQLEFLNSIKNG